MDLHIGGNSLPPGFAAPAVTKGCSERAIANQTGLPCLLVLRGYIQRASVFLCVGTSGVVYPAAGLVGEMVYRKSMGERVRSIYVGLERPANAAQFDQIVLGKAGEVLPGLLAA